MRPFAVLILVLGAIAALVFALVSITGGGADGRGTAVSAADKTVVAPATGGPVTPSVLRDPDRPVDPAQPLVEGTPLDDRVALGGAEASGGWHNQLSGVVLGPGGEPLPNARIQLLSDGASLQLQALQKLLQDREVAPERTQRTGEDGRFAFRALEPGKPWTVVVLHNRFARREVGPITMPEKGTVEETIQLQAGFGLRGVVLDARTTQPIPGAALVLDNPIYTFLESNRKSPERLDAVADEEGRFFFPTVDPGQRTLTVKARGYATQMMNDLHFFGGVDPVQEREVLMTPGKIIAGRVLAPDRKGIAGAEIDAICHGDLGSRGLAVSTKDGEFVVEDVAEGTYTLRVKVAGWDVDPIPRIEAGDTDVEIVCHALGSLVGRVVDASTGRPVRDFRIQVRQVHPTSNVFGRTVATGEFRSADDGTFEMEGVKEERYVVQADAKGYASSFSDPLQVRQGLATQDVLVQLTKGATIRGRLLDRTSGAPVAGAVVSTHSNNWIESPFTNLLRGAMQSALTETKTRTDEDGRFEITLVTPETYQVQIRHKDYTPIVQNDVVAHDGQATDLGSLRLSHGARLFGVVRDAQGQPVRRAQVFLHPQGQPAFAGGYVEGNADAEGRYELRNVAPGTYTLSAARNRQGSEANPFQELIDTTSSELEITVSEGREYEHDLEIGDE